MLCVVINVISTLSHHHSVLSGVIQVEMRRRSVLVILSFLRGQSIELVDVDEVHSTAWPLTGARSAVSWSVVTQSRLVFR